PPPLRFAPGVVLHLATSSWELFIRDAPVVLLARRGSFHFDELRALGPDIVADDFDVDLAIERAQGWLNVPIGEALLDQRWVAGIGNVWKSEGLFELGLDPFAPVGAFGQGEIRKLLLLLRERMRANVDGIAHRRLLIPQLNGPRITRFEAQGTKTGTLVYMRAHKPCRRCRTPILRALQGGRSTYYCPRCQPPRRSLEDNASSKCSSEPAVTPIGADLEIAPPEQIEPALHGQSR
ncbi:MAG: hypothetical protein N2515_06950, partial [Deltaproteobacteria bacterium]|nr:hypothetical protein [Deltaproteobacteria bacterium]